MKNDFVNDFAKHILPHDNVEKSNIFRKYDCPRYDYDGSFVFINENREMWDKADEHVKKRIMHLLHEMAKDMQAKVAVEMLCLVVEDVVKRIEKIESRFEENKNE
jgi:hypothetical protein